MTDPAEQTVPDLGLVTMEDPETGEQFFVDTGDAAFRERYAALAIEHAANVQRICARYGAGFMQLATNQSLLDNLVRFAQARRRQPQIRQTARAAA